MKNQYLKSLFETNALQRRFLRIYFKLRNAAHGHLLPHLCKVVTIPALPSEYFRKFGLHEKIKYHPC